MTEDIESTNCGCPDRKLEFPSLKSALDLISLFLVLKGTLVA
jgi:hypothetical protein